MFELLKVSPEKISDKFIASAFERVTTLERELGRRPGTAEVRQAMAAGFEKVLGACFPEAEIGSEVLALAAKLKPKYASNERLRKR
jgi:lipoate-protein ligase A